MRPLTETRPKPLIEVAGKPLIEHVIGALPRAIDEIIIVVGYRGAMIRKHLGSRHDNRHVGYRGAMIRKHLGSRHDNRHIRYVEQERQEGTAAALAAARSLLSGRFLLMCADDIHGAPALAQACNYPLAILAAHHAEPQKFGVIEVSTESLLQSFEEKPDIPKSNLVSTGAMVLDERVFSYPAPRHENGEHYLTSQVAALAHDVPVRVVTQSMWIPVGYPDDIKEAERQLHLFRALYPAQSLD